jgi:cardiolipin synthase
VLKRNRINNTSRNKAELIRGGRGYFDLLKKLINEAEDLIHFQFYIFEPDKTGREIADVLIAAAKRDVKVYLLLDAYGSQKLPKSFIEEFQGAGIHFRWFQPFFKSRKFYLGRRLHHKVVVIDSYHSLVSGLNISDRYNDMPEDGAWLDWAMYCEGEVSLQLEDICRRRMKLRLQASRPRLAIKTDGCEIGVRVNDWVGRRQEITQTYLKMLREARSHVVIMTSYFMPGYLFRKSLKAAARRGIKIQMILTGDSDVPAAKYAERYMYDWLFRNNIEIWEYQKNILHGKIAVADKKFATVGSYNVNNLSAYASIELNLDVIDDALASNIEKRLQDIITNECKQITPTAYKKHANFFIRLLQGTAYNMFRFMLFIFTLRIRHPE